LFVYDAKYYPNVLIDAEMLQRGLSSFMELQCCLEGTMMDGVEWYRDSGWVNSDIKTCGIVFGVAARSV
jgi:hypothetical protein